MIELKKKCSVFAKQSYTQNSMEFKKPLVYGTHSLSKSKFLSSYGALNIEFIKFRLKVIRTEIRKS